MGTITSDERESQVLSFVTPIVVLSAVVLVVLFSINPQSAPFRPALTMQTLATSLGGLFMIVLLIERATEVFVTLVRDGASGSGSLGDAPAKDSTPAELGTSASNAITARDDEYQRHTKRLALLFGFTLSIAVCSAGVGLLGTLLEPGEANASFLRGLDIVLTSALLAGGSDAFHQFVRALETFFTESRRRMQSGA